MNCLDYQHALETEPQRVTPEMQAHAQSCAACAAWTREMQAFEGGLSRALAINVPPARELPLPRIATMRRGASRWQRAFWAQLRWRRLIWFWFPRATLAAEVIDTWSMNRNHGSSATRFRCRDG